jgi:hypothetical protein
MRGTIPDVRVTLEGANLETFVIRSKSIFDDQGNRSKFREVALTGMEAQFCGFGFKRMILIGSLEPSPLSRDKDEYELNCPAVPAK